MPKFNPIRVVQQIASTMTAGIIPPAKGQILPVNILRPKDSTLNIFSDHFDPVGGTIALGSFGTLPSAMEAVGLSADQIRLLNLGIGAGATLGVASSVLASGASATALAPADAVPKLLPAAFANLPRAGPAQVEPTPVATLPVMPRADNDRTLLIVMGAGMMGLILVVAAAKR